MPKFTYLGLTEEQKKVALEKQSKGLNPPEKRGAEPVYHILKEDDDDVKEQKRALTKKWQDARKKEIVDGIEAVDKSVSMMDPTDLTGKRKVVFEKGKAISFPEDHPLVAKLMPLCVGVEQKKLHGQHVIVRHESFRVQPDDPQKPEEKKHTEK